MVGSSLSKNMLWIKSILRLANDGGLMFLRLSQDLAVLGSNPAQIISTIQNESPIDHSSDKELREKNGYAA